MMRKMGTLVMAAGILLGAYGFHDVATMNDGVSAARTGSQQVLDGEYGQRRALGMAGCVLGLGLGAPLAWRGAGKGKKKKKKA